MITKNHLELINVLTNEDNDFMVNIRIENQLESKIDNIIQTKQIRIQFNLLHFEVTIYNTPEYDLCIEGTGLKTNDVDEILSYFGGCIIH